MAKLKIKLNKIMKKILGVKRPLKMGVKRPVIAITCVCGREGANYLCDMTITCVCGREGVNYMCDMALTCVCGREGGSKLSV